LQRTGVGNFNKVNGARDALHGMMNILVSEFVCGGGWPDAEMPASLQAEGRAMLLAVVEDLSRLPQTTLFTTWDTRFADVPFLPFDNVVIQSVNSLKEEQDAIGRWIPLLDGALIIAPEFDGILQTRCEQLRTAGVRLLNSEAEALRITSDKLETFRLCQSLRIPTIKTLEASQCHGDPPWLPCVVKLRDGAGGLMMSRLVTPGDWQEFQARSDRMKFLLQPEIVGRSLSVAAIVSHGTLKQLFLAGEQLFSEEDRFAYVGGEIPASGTPCRIPQNAIHRLVEQVVNAIPGLHGWIGFDLLLPDTNSDEPLLVEVNPRLTTSYVGYRALTRHNLAAWIVDPDHDTSPTFQGEVKFQSTGQIDTGRG